MTQRNLHIIDIRSLAGADQVGCDRLGSATSAYRAQDFVGDNDLFVVGCGRSPRLRLRVALLWPSARTVAGLGGSQALLDAVDPGWVARRFDSVIIGSGDGAFADLAHELRSLGVRITVVARSGGVDPALGASADDVRVLPDPGGDATLSLETTTALRLAA